MKKKRLSIIIKISLSILFLVCLFDMPYFYYQFIRILGLTCFLILAYFEHQKNNKIWMIVWVCSAIIINPIIKIPLGRTLWNIVDVIWVILLIISTLQKNKK